MEEASRKHAGSKMKRTLKDNYLHVLCDKGDDEAMRGLLNLKLEGVSSIEIIDRHMRIPSDAVVLASNINKLEEAPPSQRRKLPTIAIHAPGTTKLIDKGIFVDPQPKDNSARFLCAVSVMAVDHVCGMNEDKAAVWFEITNNAMTRARISIQDGAATVEIGAYDSQHFCLFAPARRVLHGDPSRCQFVIPLKFAMNVILADRVFKYTVFIWHGRRCLKRLRDRKKVECLDFDICSV